MHKPCAGCTVQNVPRPAVPLFTFVVVVVVVVMYGGLSRLDSLLWRFYVGGACYASVVEMARSPGLPAAAGRRMIGHPPACCLRCDCVLAAYAKVRFRTKTTCFVSSYGCLQLAHWLAPSPALKLRVSRR